MKELPAFAAILNTMTTSEVFPWATFESLHGATLRSTATLTDDSSPKLWEDLKKRVTEHNIRVIAQYYTRITIKRVCELLQLAQQVLS